MANHYLCFDAGTQSVKVAVCTADGRVLVRSDRPTPLSCPRPGWVEMDAEEYLSLALAGMRDCAEQMERKGLDPASGLAALHRAGVHCPLGHLGALAG
mgnify:CR=1 FL=1